MSFQMVMGHKVGPSAMAGDDGAAIGEQFAPVVGNDDAAAQQALTLAGLVSHNPGCEVIRCRPFRAPGLMPSHVPSSASRFRVVSGDRSDHLAGQGLPTRMRRTSSDLGTCTGHASSTVPLPTAAEPGLALPVSAFSEDALGGKARLDRWLCGAVAGRVR